jgi:hypothetical protein
MVLAGSEPFFAAEFPVYTDAHIVGNLHERCGPYQVINGFALGHDESLVPGIFLRIGYALGAMSRTPLEPIKTNTDRYHGGDTADEIAALVSLSLGIRTQTAGMSRTFRDGEDPRGSPQSFIYRPTPVLLRRFAKNRPLLPQATSQHDLDELTLLPHLCRLSPADAAALIVSARSYQNAMWMAESEPEMAWLLLVSAVETAAVRWARGDEPPPLERFEASFPDLHAALSKRSKKLACAVATEMVQTLGVTAKFRNFLMKFIPNPPTDRPEDWARFDWTEGNLKKALGTIYKHRCLALHEGKPFPWPMCEYPRRIGEPPRYQDIPLDPTRHARGASWLKKDTPMMLHLFEHIVRGALLNWWKSMLPGEVQK